eukprot:6182703-Pleurochrysis_carterae.AAC.2
MVHTGRDLPWQKHWQKVPEEARRAQAALIAEHSYLLSVAVPHPWPPGCDGSYFLQAVRCLHQPHVQRASPFPDGLSVRAVRRGCLRACCASKAALLCCALSVARRRVGAAADRTTRRVAPRVASHPTAHYGQRRAKTSTWQGRSPILYHITIKYTVY